MDLRQLYMVLAVFLAGLCIVAQAMNLPQDLKQNDVEIDDSSKGELDDERRATWLDTRDLEDNFKGLVFLAMQELANEGRISADVIKSPAKPKRGRWQGFCFKRTRSGRYLPYICWKGDRK